MLKDTKFSRRRCEEMVEDILSGRCPGRELNDWEEQFIDDIHDWLVDGWQLTGPQIDKLEEIHSGHEPEWTKWR